jgi:hypothetical protein
MLRHRLQSVLNQTELRDEEFRANARSLPQAPIFQKIGIIVFLLVATVSMIVSPTVASPACAQQPTPATPVQNFSGLPEQPPLGWDAKEWARTREFCNQMSEKARAHKPLSDSEFSGSQACRSIWIDLFYRQSPPPGSYPNPVPKGPSLTLPVPAPESSPQSQTTNTAPLVLSGGNPVGANGIFFDGGGEDACTAGQGQPPDVAADVSGTQAVELLNSVGFFVFDKQGHQLASQTLPNFWFSNSPGSNHLADTQISFDPLTQRWLATTLSTSPATDNGDLYFAFTQTNDATQAWNFYKLQNVCSTSEPNTPVPDMAILGYNQAWVAIDLQCYPIGGSGVPGTDQLVLIPHGILTQTSAPQSIACGQPIFLNGPVVQCKAGPFFAARPSRDISGNANQNLFLVTSNTATTPSISVTTVGANGNFVGPSNSGGILNSPSNGSPVGSLTPAQQGTCGSGSSCTINLGDSRITNVILQTGNDGNHYLLTSFHAGLSFPFQTAQSLWFIGKVETFANATSSWNLMSQLIPGNGVGWIAYPTISMDADLDVAMTYTAFRSGSFITPSWTMSKGFASDGTWGGLLGGGPLAFAVSHGTYTGQQSCPIKPPPQRWGDYMSTVWDPVGGSNGEKSTFWTVQELTLGGSNEGTHWDQLIDPGPAFAFYSARESECNVSPGQKCTLTLSTSGLGPVVGDVVIATLEMGGSFPTPPTPPDSTWVSLPIANQSGATSMTQGTCGGGDIATEYVFAHVYGASTESGTYNFKHVVQNFCNGSFAPELLGDLFVYRGANAAPGTYVLYGYPASTISLTSTVGPAPVAAPSGGTLLNIFECPTPEVPDSNEFNVTFTLPTGSPTVTAETPLSNPGGVELLADLAVPSAGTALGQYSTTCSGGAVPAHNFGWQLFLPELPE